MFFRLLLESFRRQRRRKLLAGLAILLGTTAVTAMLALATTIGDRIHAELAVYGANIVVTPKAASLAVNIGGVNINPATGNAYLHESDLPKLRTIFWANNITAISPELSLTSTSISSRLRPCDTTAGPRSRSGLWFHHPLSATSNGIWLSMHPERLAGAPPLTPLVETRLAVGRSNRRRHTSALASSPRKIDRRWLASSRRDRHRHSYRDDFSSAPGIDFTSRPHRPHYRHRLHR